MILTGLLGGSFNPAHTGHRRASLAALAMLGLDEVWWLVSPGNPLKAEAGMAPLAARFASARRVARRSSIRVTAIVVTLAVIVWSIIRSKRWTAEARRGASIDTNTPVMAK